MVLRPNRPGLSIPTQKTEGNLYVEGGASNTPSGESISIIIYWRTTYCESYILSQFEICDESKNLMESPPFFLYKMDPT